jgi:hypothetical protein
LPESIPQVISGMVIPVSAIFVEKKLTRYGYYRTTPRLTDDDLADTRRIDSHLKVWNGVDRF